MFHNNRFGRGVYLECTFLPDLEGLVAGSQYATVLVLLAKTTERDLLLFTDGYCAVRSSQTSRPYCPGKTGTEYSEKRDWLLPRPQTTENPMWQICSEALAERYNEDDGSAGYRKNYYRQ